MHILVNIFLFFVYIIERVISSEKTFSSSEEKLFTGRKNGENKVYLSTNYGVKTFNQKLNDDNMSQKHQVLDKYLATENDPESYVNVKDTLMHKKNDVFIKSNYSAIPYIEAFSNDINNFSFDQNPSVKYSAIKALPSLDQNNASYFNSSRTLSPSLFGSCNFNVNRCQPNNSSCQGTDNQIQCQFIINDLLNLLDALYREKLDEALKLLNSLGTQFLKAVQVSITISTQSLISQIDQLNTTLTSALINAFNAGLRSEQSDLINVVNQANQKLLQGTNALLNTANSQTKSIITTLAGQSSANIVTTVQNFTSPTGLLPQLLAVLNAVSGSLGFLFFDTTQTEIAAINKLLSVNGSNMAQNIQSLINTNNNAILNLIQASINSNIDSVSRLFSKFVVDLLSTSASLLDDYGNQILRFVREAVKCETSYFSPPIEQPLSSQPLAEWDGLIESGPLIPQQPLFEYTPPNPPTSS